MLLCLLALGRYGSCLCLLLFFVTQNELGRRCLKKITLPPEAGQPKLLTPALQLTLQNASRPAQQHRALITLLIKKVMSSISPLLFMSSWSFKAVAAAVLLLIVAAAAFTPSLPPRHLHITAGSSPSSVLFMNKKKKQRPNINSNKSKGFGAGSSSSSSSSSSSLESDVLIRPKTTSNFKYAGSIRPGLQSPKRIVPSEKIKFPDYALDGLPKNRPALFPWVIEVKKPDEIEKMRKSGRCAREVLDLAGREVRPGITTDEIDRIVHEATIARGAYPSPLNYHNFPKSCCTSVNEVICHGIPDDRPLEEGDIVNIDITCYLD